MRAMVQIYRRGWVAVFLAGFSIFQSVQAANFMVEIRNNFFSPAQLTIDVGDTVTWVQRGFNHSTESFDPPGVWQSDILSPGETFPFTFNNAGVFRYLCRPHASSMSGTITVRAAANTPPTVSLSQPANGAVFVAPANVTIQAAAADSNGTVTQVEFFNGGTSLGIDPSSPFSVTVSLGAGNHTLTAKATDNAGASTTSSPVNITVNAPANNPPSVSMTGPAHGAVFQAPATFEIQANASDSDGTVTKVEFVAGRTVLGTATAPPYQVTASGLAAGSYTLTARATDNSGDVTTSAPVTIVVNAAAAGPVTLAAPLRSADGPFQFSVTGTAGQTYVIQASSNLSDWSPIRTMTAPSNTFTFVDNEATSLTPRFYRVLQQ